MKIIYGIPAIFPSSKDLNSKGHYEDFVIDEECDYWCDFEIIENDNGKYNIGFETMIGFKNSDGCRNWIIECLNCMTDYMNSHNLDITRELNLYEVFTTGMNVNSDFESLEDVYAFLKLMVFGFHGKGLFDEECGTYE